MLNKLRLAAIAALSMTIVFTACKKENSNNETNLSDTQVQTHNDDQSFVAGQVDAIADDANTSMEANAGFGGRLDGVSGLQGYVCGATVVPDTLSNPRKITVTYNGTNCGGFTRTGTVVFSMPANVRWRDQGAAITVQITNLKITRVRDNKSITINGTQTITNTTGGRLFELANRTTPIVHTVTSSNMSITFDDGSVRSWQVARQRSFTYSGGVVLTITGLHTDNNTTGISEWGTTRFGTPFVTAITQPIVIRQDCNFRVVSGQVEHSRLSATVTVTFGLDATGNAISCPVGSYYMKVVISRTGQQPIIAFLPY